MRGYFLRSCLPQGDGLESQGINSGKYQGQLKITSWFFARPRRWLYFAGLRAIQKSSLKSWYAAKKLKDKQRGKGAVVAVMYKLALPGMPWHTVRNRPSPERLLKKPSKAKSFERPAVAIRRQSVPNDGLKAVL